jgi:hypothetical protein
VLAAEVADEGRRFQFGNEPGDGGGVDGLRIDPAQARPAGKARQAIAHTIVGHFLHEPAPGPVEYDTGGLEHRPQARDFYGGGQVAAQVRPPLARDLGLRRHHRVEGRPDAGELERDRSRRLSLEFGEGGDGGTQIPLAGIGEAGRTGQPIEHVLQRCRSASGGKGIRLHRVGSSLAGGGPDGTAVARG